MIVEFNGLPGCGKTTISKDLYTRLKDARLYDDIRVKFPSGFINRVCYILKNWKVSEIVILMKIADCFENSSFSEKISRVLYTEQILANYRWIKDENFTCISDQGIIQAIVSIGFIHKLKSDNARLVFCKESAIILSFYSEYIAFVNTHVDPVVAKDRIRGRKGNTGRLDKVDNDKSLTGYLDNQKVIFDLLGEILSAIKKNAIDINSNIPSEDNAVIIKNYLIENHLI